MAFVTTTDGTEIFYKDWGPKDAEPLFFHHGWPLSADDWDSQMMFFLAQGYRVIAHDRRGHGRSTQTSEGHDMDTYAADAEAVVKALGLTGAVHIGHSTGGGEVTRYVATYGVKHQVAKAVLISAIPPTFMQSERNPDGVPKAVVDGIRDGPPTIGRNSTRTSQSPSTASTATERWCRKASGTIGGARA
jgi:non-heme chloroperoxidase